VELCPNGTIRLHGIGGRGAEEARERADDELLLGPTDLAPEQLVGGGVEARTDVYLLGLLLGHMLAREPLHGGGAALRLRAGAGRGLRPTRLGDARLPLAGSRVTVEQVLAGCLRRRVADRVADMAALGGLLVAALRAETTAPTDLLIARALFRGGLGEEPAASLGRFPGLRRRFGAAALRRIGAAALFLLVGAGAAAWFFGGAGDATDGEGAGVRGVEQRAAQLRVLAQPWAEVHVDGKLVDTTPIGRPIEVTPGRHEVRFKHPNAPDQLRTVEVIAGQTIWLDVTMPITRAPTAAASADAAANESP
jgi:serine/threonine-protein kinase